MTQSIRPAILASLLVMVPAASMAASSSLLGGDLPGPITNDEFPPRDPAKEELGRMLFYDKILSGNKNISCATCHHSLTMTGDGLSLPIGEGGRGLGVMRDPGEGPDRVHERVPRNAPPVFNLGSSHFTDMFHDGRVAVDPTQPSGFLSPAGDNLPLTLENVLAAQAMFPVTSAAEMAGQVGENPIADATAMGDLAGPNGVWAQLADRLREIPGYVEMFKAAFDHIDGPEDITYADAANAISAFESGFWRFDESPFHRFLAGDADAMSPEQIDGMNIFYGEAGCASCHSGPHLTDLKYYAIGMPQIGTGKGDNLPGDTGGHEDFGRERVTGDPADRYKFRTPTLTNIAMSPPFGHGGAYDTLEGIIRHHLQPKRSLYNYDRSQVTLPLYEEVEAIDFWVMNNRDSKAAIRDAVELARTDLTDEQVNKLVVFLRALTDPRVLDLRKDVPLSVPSGLSVVE